MVSQTVVRTTRNGIGPIEKRCLLLNLLVSIEYNILFSFVEKITETVMQRLEQSDIFIYFSFQIPFEMIENTNKMQNKSHTFIIMQA